MFVSIYGYLRTQNTDWSDYVSIVPNGHVVIVHDGCGWVICRRKPTHSLMGSWDRSHPPSNWFIV